MNITDNSSNRNFNTEILDLKLTLLNLENILSQSNKWKDNKHNQLKKQMKYYSMQQMPFPLLAPLPIMQPMPIINFDNNNNVDNKIKALEMEVEELKRNQSKQCLQCSQGQQCPQCSSIPVAPIPVAPIPVAPIPVAPIPVAPISSEDTQKLLYLENDLKQIQEKMK